MWIFEAYYTVQSRHIICAWLSWEMALKSVSTSGGENGRKQRNLLAYESNKRFERCSDSLQAASFNNQPKTSTSVTKTNKTNSMVWVRERTIPTERPPLVDEVTANVLRIEGATRSAWRIPRPYSRFSRQEPLLFYQIAPQLYSRGWMDPVPDRLLFFLVPRIETGPPDL
jgi:hypothetical protein